MRNSKLLAGAAQMKPARKTVVPKDETKEQKLVRLATTRTKRIIKAIDNLGNLSRLKPSKEHTEKVFGAIKTVAENSYARWNGDKVDVDFSL